MFLVDRSDSSKVWISDLVREPLTLLCEPLESLGERFDICGSSEFIPKRRGLFAIKQFEEAYDRHVRERIGGVTPEDCTRMGAFIRHLPGTLLERDSRTRLQITLSDGRRDDQGGYRGEYGVEDERQALLQARYAGKHPYGIDIDEQAIEYLLHMFGANSFAAINKVERLPQKVSKI